MEEIANMSDTGSPFVLSLPDSLDIVQTYNELGNQVQKEVERLSSNVKGPSVEYDIKLGKVVCDAPDLEKGADHRIQKMIDPYHLRIKCKSADNTSEVDGR